MKKTIYFVIATAFFFFSISPVPGFAFSVSVTQGNASVSTSGNTVTITATGKAILQGNTSIPAGTTVNIIQGLNNVLLRDTSGSATNILGSLLSNGNIILINTMGIYIGQSANVNVRGLIASTMDIKNAAFMNGTYQFNKVPGLNPAQILNEANITIPQGGYIILLADQVINKGTITAYMGTVALGSGQQATVSFDQGGLVNLVIDQGLAQQLTDSNGNSKAQIINNGTIHADGGKVQMSAQLLKTSFSSILNNTGIIEANSVVNHNGVVELTASGAINNSGTIQAASMTEQGETFHSTGTLDIGHGSFSNLDGAINISGNVSGSYSDVDDVDLTGAVTLTGDTTLTADSGDTGTQGEIVMNGNSITGGGFNLTLTAGVNDILDGAISGVNLLILNSSTATPVTFTSTGSSFSVATLQTNYGSVFSRSQGAGTSVSPYMIYSVSNAVGGLQYIPTEGFGSYYQLANNINAAETRSWNGGQGFVPVGTALAPFTGTLDGNGHTVENLFINLPSTSNPVGLFGEISGATIENVGLININVTGHDFIGGLVGFSNSSSINNSYTTGSVSGSSEVGGLVGYNYLSNIDNSYATDSVSGSGANVGGLVGINYLSSIDNSYATGSVSGTNEIGGLVGYNSSGSIDNSYATGPVSGLGEVGGLVGYNYLGNIDNSYAIGNVISNGGAAAGGLVGYNLDSSVTNSYATGSIIDGDDESNSGGLVGQNEGSSSIVNSYYTDINYQNGYGIYDSDGPSDFFNPSNPVYSGWDISSSTGHVWAMSGENNAYPLLQFRYSTTITDATQLQLMFLNLGATYNLANNIDASETSGWNAGNGFIPVGSSLAPFTGTFDGDGHSISDLFINLPSTSGVGLFGETSGATIENVGLVDDSITGQSDVGGLVGINDQGGIIDSYATGSVSGVNSGSLPVDIGGLVGYNGNSSNIDDSYVSGSVQGGQVVGGLAGENNSSSIANSYATASVSSSDGDIGGLVGWNINSGNISNSYATGNVSTTYNNTGGLVGLNDGTSSINNSFAAGSVIGGSGSGFGGLAGSSYGSINNSFYTDSNNQNGNGTYDSSGPTDFFNSSNPVYSGWDISSTTGHTWAMSGDDDAYPLLQFRYSTTITDATQLQLMFLKLGATYNLANNIDASETSGWNAGDGFAPIGITSPFTGIFNGNRYAIFNLNINLPSTTNVGLFGRTSGATIENVGLLNANIVGNFSVGSLVGYNNSSSIINSYASGSVSGNTYVGGLVGYNTNSSRIDNSYATDSVISSDGEENGGLVGLNYSSIIDNSYASGNVSGAGIASGGLVGVNFTSSSIMDSYATGSVSGDSDVGGLVGSNRASSVITNSFATGNVSGGSSSDFGGLVGVNNSSTITNSYLSDSSHENGLGTYELGGAAAFYSPLNPVYAIGTAGQWDIFTPIWDTYTDQLPHLHFENYAGDLNSIWIGTTSTDWIASSNWVNNSAPGINSGAVIFSSPNDPTLSTSASIVGLSIGSGTFTQDGLLSLSGNYYQSGGTVQQNAVLTIAGSFTNTGGAFNAASQPITFTGSGNITSSGISFNNLAIDAPSGTYALMDGLTVNGDLNIEAGTLSAGTSNINVGGNWDNSGGTFGAGSGTVTLTGSGSITSNNSGGNPFINLTIDAPSGTYALMDGLLVDGNLNIEAGTLSAGTSNISVGGNWDNSGGTFSAGSGTVTLTGSGSITTNTSGGNPFDYLNIDAPSGTYTVSDGITAEDFNLTNGTLISDPSSTSFSVMGYFSLSPGVTFDRFTGSGSGGDPYMIWDVYGLQGTNDYLTSSYTFGLHNDIDATSTVNWNSGAGFVPIGNSTTPFTGTFNGNGYTISNLYVNLPTTNNAGLFGFTTGATIQNIGLLNVNVTAYDNAGALVGSNNNSSIDNSYSAGIVDGRDGNAGGLVGYNISSSIDNSYANVTISDSGVIYGGLVGRNISSTINNSYANGAVHGGNYIGGLVGYNDSSSINNSYATGNVSGNSGNEGGLVGDNINSTIKNSYASGSVSGSDQDNGGLIGRNSLSSSITNSYAVGNVSGGNSSDYGGLIGYDDGTGNITNSYYSDVNHQNGLGTYEPGGAAAFYSPANPVYAFGTAGQWDILTPIWDTYTDQLPHLHFEDHAGDLNTIWIGATSTDWNAPTNWSSDSVPGASSGAVIFSSPNDPTLSTGTSIAGLSIGSGTFTQGGDLTLSGNYYQSGGTVQQNAGLSIAGDFTQTGGSFVSNPSLTSFSVTGSFLLQGGTFDRFTGSGSGGDPYLIWDVYGLQGMNDYLSSPYTFGLHDTFDATTTTNWNSDAGFVPIGSSTTPFTGTFNGNSYSISNLNISLPSTDNVALFGYTSGATVENVGLTNVNISGKGNVGGLVGSNTSSSVIEDSYVTGSVSGVDYNAGGLVGANVSSSISDSFATDTVSGDEYVGGLVGSNTGGSISNSYATGSVAANGLYIGGLVGYNYESSTITDSYASGSVSGTGTDVGGLVGYNVYSNITNSFATGIVNGTANTGGLVGDSYSSTVDNSYYSGTPNNGIGTYVSGSAEAFYSPANPVYDFGNAGQWDILTPIWDTYTDQLPHLHFENHAGDLNSIWIGATSTDWNTPTNWSSDSVPGASSGAVIFSSPNDPTLSTGTSIEALSIGSGTFTQGGDLTVSGNYYQSGGTVQQNADLSIGGDYILTGGSFVSNPSLTSFSVTGSFSLQGGAFDRFTGSGLSNDPYLIWDIYGLQGMEDYLSSSLFFGLNNDIDASSTSNWNAGAGFVPIGNSTTPFIGNFNGNGYAVSHLTINLPSADNVGLFGFASGAVIGNVGISGSTITGEDNVGGLVGENYNSSAVSNSFATGGAVSGTGLSVGGLVGYNGQSSAVDNSYATASVSGSQRVGGLVGYNQNSSVIDDSYATGSVTASGIFDAGGLVGKNNNTSTISNSYATGNVSGQSSVGGLSGSNISSSITDSYATGSVSGSGNYVGGLVGANDSLSTVSNSFATGVATAPNTTPGGLIGYDDGSGNTDSNDWWYNATSAYGIGSTMTVGNKAGALSDLYSPVFPVYAVGTAGGWDIFTPVWDTYVDQLPHLHFEDFSGNLNPLWLGGTSNDFDTGSNWSTGAIPALDSTVIIGNGITYGPILDISEGPYSVANFIMDSGTFTQDGALTLSGSYLQVGGTFEQGADLSIGGGLTLNGGTFNVSSSPSVNLDLSGNWTNNAGTFNANNGNVILTGGNQQISGDNTFYNLTKIDNNGDTLTFAGGNTQTVAGQLQLAGRLTDQLLLRSNNSPQAWLLDLQGTVLLSYLNVEDSHANGTPAECLTGCRDSGNNIGWIFPQPSTAVTSGLSSLQRQEILQGMAPEITSSGHFNGANVGLQVSTGNGEAQQQYWTPYGHKGSNIYDNHKGLGKTESGDADHALGNEWGIELVSASLADYQMGQGWRSSQIKNMNKDLNMQESGHNLEMPTSAEMMPSSMGRELDQ